MKFTLDLEIMPYKYRLTANNSWRKLSESIVYEKDKKYPDLRTCLSDLQLFMSRGYVKVNGSKHEITDQTALSKLITPELYPLIHRDKNEKPKLFSKDSLRKVIGNGDDSRNNILTVDLEGYLVLYGTNYLKEIQEYNIPVSVRNEAFIAGNDYIGLNAVKDNSFINETYLALLDGWYTHLLTGKLDVFVDVTPSESEEELIRIIDELFK